MVETKGRTPIVNELECDGLWLLTTDSTRVKNELFSLKTWDEECGVRTNWLV